MVPEEIVSRTNVNVAHAHARKLACGCGGTQTESMVHTAALLAGGKSTRMRQDKATLVIDGKQLWERQLDLLRTTNPAELLISGRSDGPYAVSAVRIVPDLHADLGPLGGIATLLNACASEWLLVLAVDLPAMTASFLAMLLQEVRRYACGVVPVLGPGMIEPLAAVYPKAGVAVAERQLAARRFKLADFIEELERASLMRRFTVRPQDMALFTNWNRPEDVDVPRAAQPTQPSSQESSPSPPAWPVKPRPRAQ